MVNNAFLAKVVTFDRNSLLFEINNLVPATEEYRLVVIYDKWAYDLQSNSRYLVISSINNVILPEYLGIIRFDIKYVYSYYSLDNLFINIKDAFGIKESYNQFLSERVPIIKQIHDELTNNGKIIDIGKINSLIKKRKF